MLPTSWLLLDQNFLTESILVIVSPPRGVMMNRERNKHRLSWNSRMDRFGSPTAPSVATFAGGVIGASSSSSSALPSSVPISRSRTLFFLSIRSSFGYHQDGPQRSIRPIEQDDQDDQGSDEETGLLTNKNSNYKGKQREKGLPPVWVDTSDSVNAILDRITQKTSTLDKMHAKHCLPGFTDRSSEERDIENLTQSITRDFRQAQAQIKQIQPSGEASKADLVSASNVQRGLAAKVQDLSAKFRRKQRAYMERLQGHAAKNASLMRASGVMLDGDSKAGAGGIEELEDDLQASQSQLLAQTAGPPLDKTIRRREAEISKIAQSITELANLFRDLGDMVLEQGTMMDSIEYNIEVVARETEGAVEELKIATRYQSQTGRRKCILFLLLMIFAVVIVIIYKPRSHSIRSSPTQPTPPSQTSSLSLLSPGSRLSRIKFEKDLMR
ncbi:SNARE protein TLG2/Syntaxin 16 [Phaffia rhodozyma]|uniref:SNARE protein TLG2/Syntaxin 16 n=1 Tax=Phaffia rhodozyma TaxID=264483 RepID=A0A0F7SRY9_PHARH|nr:SNARE protein TLG2/Syntaxin 16 [Phaffia rhodozyma]